MEESGPEAHAESTGWLLHSLDFLCSSPNKLWRMTYFFDCCWASDFICYNPRSWLTVLMVNSRPLFYTSVQGNFFFLFMSSPLYNSIFTSCFIAWSLNNFSHNSSQSVFHVPHPPSNFYHQQTFSTSVLISFSSSLIFNSSNPCRTSLETSPYSENYLLLSSLCYLSNICPCSILLS